MGNGADESPAVLRLCTINKYTGIYISCYIIDVLLVSMHLRLEFIVLVSFLG